MPRQSKKLPKKLVVLKNNEKEGKHESWDNERDMLNIPHPFRLLLTGGVNSGKTLTVKNIIVRIAPVFQKIYLLHCGGSFTTEYDEIDHVCLDSIPTASDPRFNGKEKALLIVEDKAFEHSSKQEKHDINRLFGYMSTHRNLSIIMTSQNFFDVPVCVRRMSNFFIVWKVKDLDNLKTLGRRLGIPGKYIVPLMERYITTYTDSIWFDDTPHTPYPIRLNGYQTIDKDAFIAEYEREMERAKAQRGLLVEGEEGDGNKPPDSDSDSD